jgi:DNA-binding MarR family transcriptional regulator
LSNIQLSQSPYDVTMTTRWLTDEEQRTWRLFLTACQSLFGTVEAQLLRDSGLPHGYYEILVHLSEAPGRSLRMSQLAAASMYSKSRLSHAVSKLETRGLVVRLDCPTDRRGQIAQLTEKGFGLLEEAAPGHVDQVRRSLIDALTPEQVAQLGEISAAMVAAATGQVRASCAGASADADPIDAEIEADSGCGGSVDDDGSCPG